MKKKLNWKASLARCRELMAQSGSTAYERAVLLVDVFGDPEFRAENQINTDRAAIKYLDAYCEDLCVRFTRLQALLKRFTDRSESPWSDGKFASCWKQLAEEQKAERGESTEIKRKRVSSVELQEAEQATEDERAKVKYLKAELDKATARIRELEAENAELRRENAELRGRLAELTRLLDRQSVAA